MSKRGSCAEGNRLFSLVEGGRQPCYNRLTIEYYQKVADLWPRYGEIDSTIDLTRYFEGKPAKIVERMVEGRIEKYYKEVCLLEQPFVKDPDINVTKMLGGKADVVRFVRFERGEGLEKRQDNLAADIAAEQAKMKK